MYLRNHSLPHAAENWIILRTTLRSNLPTFIPSPTFLLAAARGVSFNTFTSSSAWPVLARQGSGEGVSQGVAPATQTHRHVRHWMNYGWLRGVVMLMPFWQRINNPQSVPSFRGATSEPLLSKRYVLHGRKHEKNLSDK